MHPRLTLKTTLIGSFLAAACLPLILAGTALLYLFSDTFKDEITERHFTMAKTMAGEVNWFLSDYRSVLEYAADRFPLRESDPGSSPDQRWEALIKRYRLFESVKVLDGQGRITALAPFREDHLGLDLSGQPFIREAMATGEAAWSNVYLSSRTGHPAVSLAIPFSTGTMVGDLNLAVLQDITEEIKPGPGGYGAMVDRAGHLIAHPNRSLVLERINARNLNMVRQGLGGEEGTYQYVFDGAEKIGSVALVPETGWLAAVSQSEDQVFAPIERVRRILWDLTGLVGLAALLVVWLFLKKAMAPLSRLAEATKRISGGDYRMDDLPAGYPEINLISDALKSLARAIGQRETSLRQSEAKYRELFENALDLIYTVDVSGNMLEVNEAFLRELGWEREEVVGRHSRFLIHPDDLGVAAEAFERGKRGESPEFELRVKKKDGGTGWYSFINRPILDQDGRVVAIHGIARDVTERKEAEEALRRSEKRFKDLYDSVSDLIYTQDLQGRFLSLNRAMSSIFGYEPWELIGARADRLMKPELRPLYDTEYLASLRQAGRHQAVTAYFAKDGRKIYLEYVSTLVEPEDGEPFISGIARDVTDRVMAGRSIKEREQRIQAILEASPNPLVVYDPDGNLIYLNPAFTSIFGWTQEELQGKKVPFVPEDQIDRTAQRIKELYSTGESGTLETRRLTKDGRALDVLVSAAMIRGPKGRPAGTVVSLTDLTEKKRMEAGLLQVQKMEAIAVLAGGIAHDFNNLLMGIQGSISLMLSDLAPDHPYYRRLLDIEQYAHQGAMLTRQLLGFARGGKYEVRVLELNPIIQEHNEVFGRTRKDIRIVEDYEPELWAVAADESQMRQILMNLYINAADVMPEGGDITVRTRNLSLDHGPHALDPGRYVRLSVTDTGPGMDKETQERIFEPFFTTKEKGRGTGLGLASVYGIVKNHGGFIEVASRPGKGTTFHVYLPAATGNGTGPHQIKEASEAPLTGEGTVLLVDDEEMVLEVGRKMLEQIGYRVYYARNADEALALFQEHMSEIDLVILDMIMPDVGGGRVFDQLKALDPTVKVLLSSGYSRHGQAQAILDRGCEGFIQKPFTLRELNERITKILK